ncbi:aspartate aminotransferase family protein [Geminicoccus roseus]|uniref:aspartate aminotransferase family protein n=1 Tax=Geminicoccus roseus TaxID=404900 RepID=UPI0005573F7F|nr:aminotransferase class III-fold pyridoxal phosphate-dependent enzyme [Geminicoccus roseus]
MQIEAGRRNATVESALEDAERRYTAANPNSLARMEAAQSVMPGGSTRTILHFSPFPLTFVKGEGAKLHDADGHVYLDYLGEYTAGLYGHSNPAILDAVRGVLDSGITLGGPNLYEAELATLMCQRYPSLDLVRFCNSGTEANLNAFCAARAVTGCAKILLFHGAYHGGCFTFAAGPGAMNAPFDVVLADYNDIEGTQALIDQHAGELAAVGLEPMMGAGGGIPASPDFLAMLRERTEKHGIVLVFDEVMTSRLAPGGLQAKRGVIPDMTTFGKYLGGGLTFGAFGGRRWIMDRFDARKPGALGHSGTYNNNVLTMAAGVAGLRHVFTPEASIALNESGDRLRARLNEVFQKQAIPFQVTGEGSINCIHFHDRPVRRPADAPARPELQALFQLEMILRGIYLARRGFITLCLPLTEDDHDRFVAAVEDFCEVHAPILRH